MISNCLLAVAATAHGWGYVCTTIMAWCFTMLPEPIDSDAQDFWGCLAGNRGEAEDPCTETVEVMVLQPDLSTKTYEFSVVLSWDERGVTYANKSNQQSSVRHG